MLQVESTSVKGKYFQPEALSIIYYKIINK